MDSIYLSTFSIGLTIITDHLQFYICFIFTLIARLRMCLHVPPRHFFLVEGQSLSHLTPCSSSFLPMASLSHAKQTQRLKSTSHAETNADWDLNTSEFLSLFLATMYESELRLENLHFNASCESLHAPKPWSRWQKLDAGNCAVMGVFVLL